jgi:hypothetical protein
MLTFVFENLFPVPTPLNPVDLAAPSAFLNLISSLLLLSLAVSVSTPCVGSVVPGTSILAMFE